MEKEYKIGLSFEEILEIIIALEIRADTMEQLGSYECCELIKDLRVLIEKIRDEYKGV